MRNRWLLSLKWQVPPEIHPCAFFVPKQTLVLASVLMPRLALWEWSAWAKDLELEVNKPMHELWPQSVGTTFITNVLDLCIQTSFVSFKTVAWVGYRFTSRVIRITRDQHLWSICQMLLSVLRALWVFPMWPSQPYNRQGNGGSERSSVVLSDPDRVIRLGVKPSPKALHSRVKLNSEFGMNAVLPGPDWMAWRFTFI